VSLYLFRCLEVARNLDAAAVLAFRIAIEAVKLR
jgi:hypothetical protein